MLMLWLRKRSRSLTAVCLAAVERPTVGGVPEQSLPDPLAEDPALALRLFRSNRDAGFILLSAIILGAVSWPF